MKQIKKIILLAGITAALTITGGCAAEEENKPIQDEPKQQEETVTFSPEEILATINKNYEGIMNFDYQDGIFIGKDESGTFQTLLMYYVTYGNIDVFTEDFNGLLDTLQGLCGIIDQATGEKNTIAITNPNNPDNWILMINADGIIYNAFQ